MNFSSQLLFLRAPPTLCARATPQLLNLVRPSISTINSSKRKSQRNATRAFINNSLSPTIQTLSASRTLPYPSSDLYALITDIASYPAFLPYCTSSNITAWTSSSPTGTRYPSEADLRIGWAGYDESFRSKVFCVPETIVEAVAGEARTSIPASELNLYNENAREDFVPGNELFSSLLTRWSLREFPFKPLPPDGKSPQEGNASTPSRARTEVKLLIEVRFASAMYAALSQAAAPKVAGVLIDAFEKRAREVLGKGQVGHGEQMEGGERSSLEGVVSDNQKP